MKHRTVASVLMGAALALMVLVGISSGAARADNGAWWGGNPTAPPGSGNPSPNPVPDSQWRTTLDLSFTNTGNVAREYRVVVVGVMDFKGWAKWHWRRGWANAGQALHARTLTSAVLQTGAPGHFTGSVSNRSQAFIVVQSRDTAGFWPDYWSWGHNRNPWKNLGFTRLVKGAGGTITNTFDVAATTTPPATPQVPLTFGNQLAGTKFTAITLTYPSNGISRTAGFTTPIVPGTSLVFDLATAKDLSGNDLLVRDVPFVVKWANATDAATAPGQVFTFESNTTTHVAELFTVNTAGEMRDHNNLQINSLIPGAPSQ